jgi:hypothetical protein
LYAKLHLFSFFALEGELSTILAQADDQNAYDSFDQPDRTHPTPLTPHLETATLIAEPPLLSIATVTEET